MNRNHDLDSLRGLAALVVVISHCNLMYRTESPDLWLLLVTELPLFHCFMKGTGAVMLFFVLSGYVLALSLDRHPVPWRLFVARRFCRIYLPFIAAILLSAILGMLAGVPDDRAIWPATWTPFMGSPLALVYQIGMFDSAIALDPPGWSLVHEWRISLLFPFLFVCVRRWPRATLAACFLLYWTGESTNQFLLHFAAGAWMALHRERIIASIRSFTRLDRAMMLFSAIIVLSVNDNLTSGLGAVALLALVISVRYRMLAQPWCLALGRVSYSNYLTHMIVMMAVGRFLGFMPVGWRVLIALPLIAVVAWASYRIIELPSIELGRLIGRCATRRHPLAVAS